MKRFPAPGLDQLTLSGWCLACQPLYYCYRQTFHVKMKQYWQQVYQELLTRYEQEGDAFIRQIVTGDEPWTYHHDPANKHQSREYGQKNSPTPKKC